MDCLTGLNEAQRRAVTATEGLKALFGYHLVKQGKWIRNIVEG